MVNEFKYLNRYPEDHVRNHGAFAMIMSCFCRSYDEGHINKEKLHLISSIVYSEVVFSAKEYAERFNRSENYFLFVVYSNKSEKAYYQEKKLSGLYSG